MPISEDEYEHLHGQSNVQSTMSKAEQRRNNKPIMEKKRRARINHCLNELKSLILDAMKKDPARHSKLEKADILEMTVKHLQNVQRQQLAIAVATDPTVLHKFKSGFNECAGEVSRYIGNMDGVENGVKQRLVSHLTNCVSGLQQITPFSFPGLNATGGYAANSNAIPISIPQEGSNSSNSIQVNAFSGDVNNNQNAGRIQVPVGLQLIPSRLPTGELALLVPNSSNLPFFSPSVISNVQSIAHNELSKSTESLTQRTFQSAFTTVRSSFLNDSKYKSPPLSPASSMSSDDEGQTSDGPHYLGPTSPKYTVTSLPKSSHGNAPSTVTAEEEAKPAQQFHVSSTSQSPESASEAGPKIEFKTMPIYQPSDKHKEVSYESRRFDTLSVITDNRCAARGEQQQQPRTPGNADEHRDTLKRKRPNYEAPEGLLTLATEKLEPKSKYARFGADSDSTTNGSPGSSDHWSKVNQQTYKPSTSAGNDELPDANNDMWRPW